MTHKFTTPCFIRKNTAELRKKLEKLGYSCIQHIDYTKDFCLATSCYNYRAISEWLYDCTNPNLTWNCAGRIDCGTNEDMFLAIAALRENTDEWQWFIMDAEVYADISKKTWFKATDINGGRHIGTQIDPLYCHKATVEEIIEHFK